MSDFHSRLLKRFKKEPALDLDYDSARSTECLGNFPHNISEQLTTRRDGRKVNGPVPCVWTREEAIVRLDNGNYAYQHFDTEGWDFDPVSRSPRGVTRYAIQPTAAPTLEELLQVPIAKQLMERK